MTKLRLIPFGKPAKVAEAKGFHWVRRVGSHNIYRDQTRKIIVIPDHGSQVIVRPLLRKILRDMNISPEEHERILKEV